MNVLGLLVHLAMAENQVFVIEELEDDIHPRALRALLDFVAEKSASNQFMISTHSNIVLKHLGCVSNAKIIHVDCGFPDRLPTSTVREVANSPEDRRVVLQDLGYELGDVDMWDAWLILEESSAEKIIRQYLIPWFVPEMQSRLRTYSAHSLSEVPKKFQAFNDLFVFLNLQPGYKNRAWVIVDGGTDEQAVIEQLKIKYVRDNGWKADHFVQLNEHDFERYYPEYFTVKVDAAISERDKQIRRKKKKDLLSEVEVWIAQDRDSAKTAFERSAADVITVLRSICRGLSP